MTLTGIDPTTFVVPVDQALLYVSNSVVYYKRSNGTTGTVSDDALKFLGVPSADIPCLVYEADLLRALPVVSGGTSGVVNANSKKASTIYTDFVSSRKINKHTFLTELIGIHEGISNAEDRLTAIETKLDALLTHLGLE